jgi:tyrosine-protein phosphatase SIW14
MRGQSQVRTAVRSIAVTLLLAVPLCASDGNPAPHVHSLIKINDYLYRGAEPSPVGLQELGALGIKLVIDLRERGESTDFERRQVESLHMKYVNVPFRPFSAPTQEGMRAVLSLILDGGSDPIFIHCRRGKDRTGTVVACYRIQHDGWTNQRALSEAEEDGLSMAERGMRSYILHFTPLTLSGPSTAGR